MVLFSEFYHHKLDITKFNRAVFCLIPKVIDTSTIKKIQLTSSLLNYSQFMDKTSFFSCKKKTHWYLISFRFLEFLFIFTEFSFLGHLISSSSLGYLIETK
jgi:hypothetical protein